MSSPDYSAIDTKDFNDLESDVFNDRAGKGEIKHRITVKHTKSVDNLNVAVACHPPLNEGIPEHLLPSFLPIQDDLSIQITERQGFLLI